MTKRMIIMIVGVVLLFAVIASVVVRNIMKQIAQGSAPQPAVVVTVGESSALLRHLDGDLRQSPLRVLAPDPLDPAGTCRSLLGQDAL